MLHRWTSRPKWFSSANWLDLLGASKIAACEPNAFAKRSAVIGLNVASSETSDPFRALARLDDQLVCAGIEPGLSCDDRFLDIRGELAFVFLAEFELHGESSLASFCHDRARFE